MTQSKSERASSDSAPTRQRRSISRESLRELVSAMRDTGHETVDYIFICHEIGVHWQNMVELIRPFGRIVAIAETEQSADLHAPQPKAAGFCWEFMFGRAIHGYNSERLGEILTELAQLLDDGRIQSALGEVVGPLSVKNLAEAHRRLEADHTLGKPLLTAME